MTLMDVKNNLYLIFSLIAVICIFSSCTNKDNFKEIDLTKTEKLEKIEDTKDNDTLYVGFDLRWEPVEDLQFYLPIINYLKERTGLKFKIVVPRNYLDNIHMLGNGKIDISFMGTVSCLISRSKYGSYPIVFGLNGQNEPYYRSAIVKKAGNDDIKSVEDIKNKKFAFGNKYSTQGYLIPRKMLEDSGIKLENLDYEFSDSHKDVVNKIVNGFSDAGAVQDRLAFKMEEEGTIEIIKLSDLFPSSTVCVSPLLERGRLRLLKRALLQFDPKKDIHSDMWKFTEMENGFTDAEDIELKELMLLIKEYYNLK